jgi:hypothetical protein
VKPSIKEKRANQDVSIVPDKKTNEMRNGLEAARRDSSQRTDCLLVMIKVVDMAKVKEEKSRQVTNILSTMVGESSPCAA